MEKLNGIPADWPDGYEMDVDNSTPEKIVFKRKSALPVSWTEFCNMHPIGVDEAYIDADSGIIHYNGICTKRQSKSDANLIPNEKKAKAFLALMKLIQLRDCYRQGWTPGWDDGLMNHAITSHGLYRMFLFQSPEIAKQFETNFKDLLKEAEQLEL